MASQAASRVTNFMYDVFLSFRGEDTRYSIVSHLYAALVSRGIITFKDDKRLEIGDHISDELYKAIEGSDSDVVVLSGNYATSRWCLMELQLIMELQMKGRLGVFPVFNGVEPSRHQLGSFDLKRYQRPEDADKVPKWREALKLIADLSGVESGLCIDEATMVGKIVDDISRRKAMMQKIDFRNIVGVDTHLQDLKSLLDMDSNNDEVRMIGIWGMGGIGKTAIAKCLYAQLKFQFEASNFTGDIKGINKDLDLLQLQKELLYSISIAGDIKFHFSAGCEGYAEYFSFCSEQKVHGTRTVSVHQAPRLISEFNKSISLNIRRFSYKENSRPVTFHNFPYISGLEELKLVNLNIQKLSDAIGHFEFLERLDFSGNDFDRLPEDMNRLSRLKTLCLRNCSKLEELPELKQVQSLTLSNCRSLRSLVKPSDAIQEPSIYCLLELCLDNCKNVKSLSDQLSHFTKLTFLDMSSHDFKTLPSSIRDLTSLVTICLHNCKKLKSLEELPPRLQFLDAEGCDSLDADALEHFKGRLNKEVPAQPQVACFQETEMLSYERQGSKSRLPKFLCCSHF
ncbi:PREDICTED: TMV resistance protein N-like [Camelina sativa]|uniref:TMV resistance protein N-like n=1 Tax=Camelina sativa TaxID=90675 RepID=A0ABM0U534_CAMSA|nr:PREDICTED: TMV resistance protein N-like [Camelina sativa]